MPDALDGQVCLVTGGASGIGQATAEALHAAGGRLVIADRAAEAGQALASRLGARARFEALDVTDRAAVRSLVAGIREAEGQLDVAVNNAGILAPFSKTHRIAPEDWEAQLSVNLTGTWHCMAAELELMSAQGHGSIVNTASVAAERGFPGAAGYAASKHGILGLTRSAALEYAEAGIRINAVCPGVVDTPMLQASLGQDPEAIEAIVQDQPTGRLLQPSEVAEAIVYLASGAASGITGHGLVIDGGLSVG